MKLANFPDHEVLFSDKELLKEWKEELPKALRGVEAAKKYFVELTSKRRHDQPLTIRDINPGYVYTLDHCISLAERKRKINDAIGKHLNEDIYQTLTGNYGYNGTLLQAQKVTQAVLNPKIYNEILKDPRSAETVYLTRDTFEQAYRICDYILAHLNRANTDERFQDQVKKSRRDVIKNLKNTSSSDRIGSFLYHDEMSRDV